MWKIVLLALSVLAGLVYVTRPERMPSASLPVYSAGDFQGKGQVGGACAKARCLVIYVAPWCPACKRLNRTMVALRDELEAEGVQVNFVIGMDKEPKLLAYATVYSKPVMLDDRRFHKMAKIKAVPYFAVVDHKGKIKTSMYSGYDDVGAMRRQLGL